MRVAAADTGDQPWDAELPAEALVEIKAAKGTVYEMGAKPWWCGPQAFMKPGGCEYFQLPLPGVGCFGPASSTEEDLVS